MINICLTKFTNDLGQNDDEGLLALNDNKSFKVETFLVIHKKYDLIILVGIRS